ncbi:MAG: TonB-dependent receptor plug domain-containing protein [Haliea sp.]|nr:TonB-dependent receptor plug domain-containing protein [Haliea sp.]
MNGHRLVGVGIGQNYPDPDVVPPGALQRVEVLTEGGSSVYGADAIGGVVNFITRRDIDGT